MPHIDNVFFLFRLFGGQYTDYLLAVFDGVEPVSYTHLDVYKRQEVDIEYIPGGGYGGSGGTCSGGQSAAQGEEVG